MFKAAIIGGTGYGGGELCRQLLQHDQIELVTVSSIDFVGQKLGDVHLNLEGLSDIRFEEMPATEVAKGVDVVFLGLPHTVSSSIAGELRDVEARIIDLSGDFRLLDVDTYNENYSTTHPYPEMLGSYVYGFPELNREQIRDARRIASPGCHATSVGLTLLPLAKAGLLDGPVYTTSATGSSGAGAYPKPITHHAVRVNNLKLYGIFKHVHRHEIYRLAREAGATENFHLEMTGVSAPLTRGILSHTMLEVSADLDEAAVWDIYRSTYADQPMVKLLENRTPQTVGIIGTSYAEVGFTLGPIRGDKRTLVSIAALDNLLKGGAGQAVQSMNICLGLDERAGLMSYMGIWP
ncbi:MAG: N-acetyl-gamma-glutamyl-phosphate reductase [Myxococcota bacterium]|nr:N-acetyl-gamma-glutamyl-phosphate reductase [Myxococcota bacterium]